MTTTDAAPEFLEALARLTPEERAELAAEFPDLRYLEEMALCFSVAPRLRERRAGLQGKLPLEDVSE